jgi:hypothetical protein
MSAPTQSGNSFLIPHRALFDCCEIAAFAGFRSRLLNSLSSDVR